MGGLWQSDKRKPRSGIWGTAVMAAAEIPRICCQRDAAGFPRQRLVLTFLNQYKGPGRGTRGLEEVRVSGYSSR